MSTITTSFNKVKLTALITQDEAAALLSDAAKPWKNLDRCPACKGFVSPHSGVCHNSRCDHNGCKVQPIKAWPVAHNLADLVLTPGERFGAAIRAFTPDLTTQPIESYLQMRQDSDYLLRLAKEAGISLEPRQPGFDKRLRLELARQARAALETLPVDVLREIAYSVGFRFPTLTQAPADTGRASSLIYWLNPIYKHGMAQVVQEKALARWAELDEAGRVEALVNETTLHRSLKKAGHAAPSPIEKYAGIPGCPTQQVIVKTRLAQIEAAVKGVARKLAGQDGPEVAAEMTCIILEKAAQDPAFMLQAKAYIINTAKCRVIDKARKERIQTAELREEMTAEADNSGGFTVDAKAVLATLPDELRQVLAVMLKNPAAYLTATTDRINATKLAAELGMSPWAAKSRLKQIQAILQGSGLVGTMA